MFIYSFCRHLYPNLYQLLDEDSIKLSLECSTACISHRQIQLAFLALISRYMLLFRTYGAWIWLL